MGGSEESPVSTAKIWSEREPKHSFIESNPDFDPNMENHGVHMWAGIKKAFSEVSSMISKSFSASSPKIGRPSDLIFPILSSFELNFFTISMSGKYNKLWFFLTRSFFL